MSGLAQAEDIQRCESFNAKTGKIPGGPECTGHHTTRQKTRRTGQRRPLKRYFCIVLIFHWYLCRNDNKKKKKKVEWGEKRRRRRRRNRDWGTAIHSAANSTEVPTKERVNMGS